jgi:hypothetical protein
MWPGILACLLGLGFTGFNVSWALGSPWLVDTVFPIRWVPTSEMSTTLNPLVQWLAIIAKTGAALLGLVTITQISARLPTWLRRAARILGWVAAGMITIWGATQTAWFSLAKAGVVRMPGDPWTSRAINGHAFLWDPWFLIWGGILGYALWASRRTQEKA